MKIRKKHIEQMLLRYRCNEPIVVEKASVSLEKPDKLKLYSGSSSGGPAGDEIYHRTILYMDADYVFIEYEASTRRGHHLSRKLYFLSDEKREYNYSWNRNSSNLYYKQLMVEYISATNPVFYTCDKGRSYTFRANKMEYQKNIHSTLRCSIWGSDLERVEELLGIKVKKVFFEYFQEETNGKKGIYWNGKGYYASQANIYGKFYFPVRKNYGGPHVGPIWLDVNPCTGVGIAPNRA